MKKSRKTNSTACNKNSKYVRRIGCLYLFLLVVVCKSEDIPLAVSDTVIIPSPKITSRDYGGPNTGNDYYGNYPAGPPYQSYPSYPAQYSPSSPGSYPSDNYGSSPGAYYGSSTPYDISKPKKPIVPAYSAYYNPGYPTTVLDCQEHMMHSIIGDALQIGGIGKFGLIKSLVAAIMAAILTKIPIILALKALVVKLIIVPIGLIVLVMPILVPIFLLFMPLWNRIKEAIVGTTPPPTMVLMMTPSQPAGNNTQQATSGAKARAAPVENPAQIQDILMRFLQSEQCFEKLACQLGAGDSKIFYRKPVTWLMEFLQTFKLVKSNYEMKSRLKRYRDAYMYGSTSIEAIHRRNRKSSAAINETINDEDIQVCSNEMFPCDEPKFKFDDRPFETSKIKLS